MSSDNTYPIPQTDALRQADKYSLQELFSRDPEALGTIGLEQIVTHMQDLRDRLAATATVRQVRVKKDVSPRAPTLPIIVSSASQMGFVKVKKD